VARILVAEDHPTMRQVLRLILEAEGHAIEETADGTEALERIHREPPDLLLLDLHLPGLDGSAVLEALQRDPPTSAVAVIVISAAGPEARPEALRLGASAFVTKPFAPAELVATVRRVLGTEG
jgi:CheY-like chemotaxis protein